MYLKSKTSYIILLVAFLCILPLSLASANDRDEKICSLKIEGVGPFQSIDEAEAIWRTTEFAFESKAESKLKGRLLKHLRFIKTPPDPRGAIRIFWNNTISSSNSGRGIGVNVRTSRPINPQSWRSVPLIHNRGGVQTIPTLSRRESTCFVKKQQTSTFVR